ncbi:MAG: hypothetical protein U5K55_13025 [Aliarcobacter sp.]|nr:hypothetical protein [Aliarcobacter sp.]
MEEEKTLKKIIDLLDNKYMLNNNSFFIPNRVILNKKTNRYLMSEIDVSQYSIQIDTFEKNNDLRTYLLFDNILYILALKNKSIYKNVNILNNIILPDFDLTRMGHIPKDYIISFIENFNKINVEEYKINLNYYETLVINEFKKAKNLFEKIDSMIDLFESKEFLRGIYRLNINMIKDNLNLIKSLPSYYTLDLIDNYEKKYTMLSSGEKQLLDVIYSIKILLKIII